MSVDNLALGHRPGAPSSRCTRSDTNRPPAFPMSETAGTLREHTGSPHLHRAYYRLERKKDLQER